MEKIQQFTTGKARERQIRALEVAIARLEGGSQADIARTEQRSRASVRSDERRAAAFLRVVLAAFHRAGP